VARPDTAAEHALHGDASERLTEEERSVQMTKRIIVVAAIFILALTGALAAQEKPQIIMKPPQTISAVDGPTMFQEYCASCHGKQARGDGPAAAALKTVPADLTRISARNGGTFPVVKVRRYIEGLDEIAAHGNRDMPIWGQVLRGPASDRAAVQIRVENLTKYIESLQQK
jgi:mono/diheme cytochrome c family protein